MMFLEAGLLFEYRISDKVALVADATASSQPIH